MDRTRVVVLGLMVLAPAGAAAQDAVPLEEFSTIRFAPPPGPGNYLDVEGAFVSGHLVPSVGLYADYAHHPFTLFNATCSAADETDCQVTDENTQLVEYTVAGHLNFALSIAERLQVGVVLPLILASGDSFSFTRADTSELVAVDGGTNFGVGDPRLHIKGRIAGAGDRGPSIGAAAWVTFPIGQLTAEGRYIGDESLTAGGYVIASFIQSGFHIATNLGGFFRPSQTLFSTEVGSAFTYSVAAGYELTPLVLVFAELEGESSFGGELDENPVEARLAGRIQQGDFSFTLGGGVGVVSGVGTPVFRVLGGATWAPIYTDSDGDGIQDDVDACPSEAEDFDAYIDDDGCPEADNDGDGLLDAADPCPNDPEDMDGTDDEDGCPDEDDDNDGIPDGYDSCPQEPEDMDGDRDEDGCPDNDRDRDGVPDDVDACPDEEEDTDGFGDTDGCPEDDFDQDGIPDDMDECPDQAEVINGTADQDGCPEEDADGDGIPDQADRCPNQAETLNGRADSDGCPDGDALVQVSGEEIRLLQQVEFATSSARIRGRRSRQLLDAVATILSRNPSYRRVRVEGHTDNTGNAEDNQRLSEERAQACVEYLVRAGIDQGRLYAVGVGQERPLESNETRAGRIANRRVEFHIEAGTPGAP
ncbi:MAG: OmpA family protein [Myxococcota bacterium]